MLLNVLAVGDVVGEGGQDILSRRLPGLREETGAHFTVVNGENASGVGITPFWTRRSASSAPPTTPAGCRGRALGSTSARACGWGC